MKKSLWTRLLSLLLAVVLCVELLPAVGSAVSPSEDLEHTVEGTVEEPAEVAFVLGWIPSEFISSIPIFQVGIPAILSIYFDLFTGCIQALVFCMLTMVYVGAACPPPAPKPEKK